jgi:hypothetical protein
MFGHVVLLSLFFISFIRRSVDFSSGQGAQGNPRRRGRATPHKEFPPGNAELAEKRRS